MYSVLIHTVNDCICNWNPHKVSWTPDTMLIDGGMILWDRYFWDGDGDTNESMKKLNCFLILQRQAMAYNQFSVSKNIKRKDKRTYCNQYIGIWVAKKN